MLHGTGKRLNMQERQEVGGNEDVTYVFCGVIWGQFPSSRDRMKCQMCGKWHKEVSIAASAVRLRKMPVTETAPPGDNSCPRFLFCQQVHHFVFQCNFREILKFLNPHLFLRI